MADRDNLDAVENHSESENEDDLGGSGSEVERDVGDDPVAATAVMEQLKLKLQKSEKTIKSLEDKLKAATLKNVALENKVATGIKISCLTLIFIYYLRVS